MDRSSGQPGLTLGVLLATMIAIAGCSSAPASASATPTGAESLSTACDASETGLSSPAGRQVNLTGAWRGNDGGLYNLQQEGGCLYGLGRSEGVEGDLGTAWTNVFVGEVHNDFTITGSWGDVPIDLTRPGMVGGQEIPVSNADLGDGELSIRIEFDDGGASEEPYLLVDSGTAWGFGGTRWVRESSMPDISETIGTFDGKADDCFWVEANGTRYQFNLPRLSMSYAEDPPTILDGLGHTLFARGDPIRVLGRVKGLLGDGCQPNYILTTDISAPS